MNNHQPDSWNELIGRARADAPPPADLTALLRELHVATPGPAFANWRGEFERVFASIPAMAGCATAALALLSVAGWQAWTFWREVMPWAQLLAGGVS